MRSFLKPILTELNKLILASYGQNIYNAVVNKDYSAINHENLELEKELKELKDTRSDVLTMDHTAVFELQNKAAVNYADKIATESLNRTHGLVTAATQRDLFSHFYSNAKDGSRLRQAALTCLNGASKYVSHLADQTLYSHSDFRMYTSAERFRRAYLEELENKIRSTEKKIKSNTEDVENVATQYERDVKNLEETEALKIQYQSNRSVTEPDDFDSYVIITYHKDQDPKDMIADSVYMLIERYESDRLAQELSRKVREEYSHSAYSWSYSVDQCRFEINKLVEADFE